MNISGKKIVVFGGTSGIGLATIKLLLKHNPSKIYALSRNTKKLKLKNKKIITEQIDVLDEIKVKAFFSKLGKYDVLISTATGGSRAMGPFLTMNMQGFKNSFDKLWGYSNVVRYGAEKLNKNGNIVLVSGSPARKSKPGFSAISATGVVKVVITDHWGRANKRRF